MMLCCGIAQGVNHWKSFFKDHKSYHKIGRVQHVPIDPARPIPEHCNPKKGKKDGDGDVSSSDGKKETNEFAGPQSQPQPSSQQKEKKREEL